MSSNRHLLWTQRIALIRHNLHSASRMGDFSFFKALQVQRLTEGTDYVAILTDVLEDGADALLSALDSLNSAIAYIHEDAFNKVYRTAKTTVAANPDPDLSNPDNTTIHDRRAILQVDVAHQRQLVEIAIDKTFNSAISLISEQPPVAQEAATDVLLFGTTLIADAVQVSLAQMDAIADGSVPMDLVRLEHSWATVQAAVSGAVSAIKGVMSLMAGATEHVDSNPIHQGRSKSIDLGSQTQGFFRRMSVALSTTSSSSAHSRKGSVVSLNASSPESNTGSSPTRMQLNAPSFKNKLFNESALLHQLSPIPATPDTTLINPFDDTFSKFKIDSNISAMIQNANAPGPFGTDADNSPTKMESPKVTRLQGQVANTSFPTLIDDDGDQSRRSGFNTRRRSEEISGEAPTLESVLVAAGN
ncbi:MAG: hypothetical protein M1828_006410 [Chrysothrix sp. TS-e1954]|nr:MAG: hypothetical protein M1828_006410 [Chrysothrix sp. TS-e1954]